VYRISDAGYKKVKPSYINNESCLANAVSHFPLDKVIWYIIADNVCDDTYNMIKKYVPESCIERVSVGHGAGTFRIGYEYAINNFPDNQIVYFLENDYMHRSGALEALKEGISINSSGYVTLYDHPDFYPNTATPSMKKGERSIVYLSHSCHWKNCRSTTMTMAALVSTLKNDKKIFWRWTTTTHPFDYRIFLNLRLKGKRLLSSIPGYATHGESKYLSPLVDWSKESVL
jgi:hypothetical protein